MSLMLLLGKHEFGLTSIDSKDLWTPSYFTPLQTVNIDTETQIMNTQKGLRNAKSSAADFSFRLYKIYRDKW